MSLLPASISNKVKDFIVSQKLVLQLDYCYLTRLKIVQAANIVQLEQWQINNSLPVTFNSIHDNLETPD